ncbi:MAG TPA: hypothetical protein VGV60_11870 [Candidatus Polarisedimenticolia bacterium]|jgi:hypothetical protein|nr:hypothetical protein [Candidatus Polarisedimenticolia bacterium]
MTRARAAAFVAAAFLCVASRPAMSDGLLFSVYPSYGAKFDIGSGKFSLVTNMVVYNISGQAFSDVTFKQTYPDGVSVKETYQRDIGTEATGEQSSSRKVEGNAFYASMPTFKNRMYAVIPNELVLARRLNEITFPGVEISYADAAGQRQTAKMPDNTYDLFIYSNVVGGLERFLNKYNNITFNFAKAVPNRKEWEFAPVAASAQGRFPTGVIGTFPGENQYSGHFRLRSGPPGDNIQLVVIYRPAQKNERLEDKEALLKKLREYLRWCGEFDVSQEGLQVNRGEWKKYAEAWTIDGRWVDTIKNRLGEGPLKAKVFWGGREDVEYYVLALAHGRTLGTDSANPSPEKEAQLAAEIDQILDSFKSSIVPLSYERHR